MKGTIRTVFLASKNRRCGLFFEVGGKEHCCSFPDWMRGRLVRALADALGVSESAVWAHPTAACRGRVIEVSAVEVDGKVFYTLPSMDRRQKQPKSKPSKPSKPASTEELLRALQDILKRMS